MGQPSVQHEITISFYLRFPPRRTGPGSEEVSAAVNVQSTSRKAREGDWKIPVTEDRMKTLHLVFLAVLVALAPKSLAQEKAPLRLIQRTPTPGVRKWDHFGVDLGGRRIIKKKK